MKTISDHVIAYRFSFRTTSEEGTNACAETSTLVHNMPTNSVTGKLQKLTNQDSLFARKIAKCLVPIVGSKN